MYSMWNYLGMGAVGAAALHWLWQQWQLRTMRRQGLYPAPGQARAVDVRRLVQAGEIHWARRCYRELHGGSLLDARVAVQALRESCASDGILEVAHLQLRPGTATTFEAAFAEARTLIECMPGYRSHELQRCLERPDHYLLLVRWDSVAHHEQGFRQSSQYQQWRALLHHFYDPFPTVLHYEPVQACTSPRIPA